MVKTAKMNLYELKPEEIDKVSAGTIGETSQDSFFLKGLGLMDESYYSTDVMSDWDKCSGKVDQGWAKAGITSVTAPLKINMYYYHGESIPRDKAIKIAQNR